jgi:hypothetical protein
MTMVPGSEVEAGDDLLFLGSVRRITDIEPYEHPKAAEYGWGPGWRIAWSCQPGEMLTRGNREKVWGITLEPQCTYEVGPRARDLRGG